MWQDSIFSVFFPTFMLSLFPANQVQSMLAVLFVRQGRHLCWPYPPKSSNESKQKQANALQRNFMHVCICLYEWSTKWLQMDTNSETRHLQPRSLICILHFHTLYCTMLNWKWRRRRRRRAAKKSSSQRCSVWLQKRQRVRFAWTPSLHSGNSCPCRPNCQLAPLLRHLNIPTSTKRQKLITAIFLWALMYQCQTWTPTKAPEQKLITCKMKSINNTRRDKEWGDQRNGRNNTCPAPLRTTDNVAVSFYIHI